MVTALFSIIVALGGLATAVTRWVGSRDSNGAKDNDRSFRTVDAMLLLIDQQQEDLENKDRQIERLERVNNELRRQLRQR